MKTTGISKIGLARNEVVMMLIIEMKEGAPDYREQLSTMYMKQLASHPHLGYMYPGALAPSSKKACLVIDRARTRKQKDSTWRKD